MSGVRGRWRRRRAADQAVPGSAADGTVGAPTGEHTEPAEHTEPVESTEPVGHVEPAGHAEKLEKHEPAEKPEKPERPAGQVASLRRYQAGWHRALRFVAQRLILRSVVKAITSVEVEGLRNLDGLREPFVVVANHSSHLDAAVLVTHLPRRVTRHLAVAAAADYFYDAWYRKAGTSLFFNSYPVYRGKSTGKGRGMSVRLLAAGVPVLIFPEGTRSRDGVMRRFKPGAAALCAVQDAPLVPVALIGAREAMPVGQAWPRPGRPPIRMLVGRPMRPRPTERVREFNARVEARVSAMLTMQTPYVLGDVPKDENPPAERRGDDAQEEAS